MTVIAAIDEVKGLRHYYIFKGSNNTDRFVHFMDRLLNEIHSLYAVVVMDNLNIHKTHRVKEIFSRHQNVEAFYLPPYSCNMNPIEKYWRVLKGYWRRHLVEHHLDIMKDVDIVERIDAIMNSIPEHVVRNISQENISHLIKSLQGNYV